MNKGYLKIKLYIGENVLPIGNAKVLVKDKRGNIIYNLTTDENGLTQNVALDAPDKKNSTYPYSNLPYFSTCDVEVPYYKGYKKVIIHDVQIFESQDSLLPIQLHPTVIGGSPEENTDEIYIPHEHGVDMPRQEPKGPAIDNYNNNYTDDYIFEDDFEYGNFNHDNVSITETILANEVKIPQYITVHLGSPNAVATNVRVSFTDYIKNVASSEIFPTWEESALYANIYAQISFTLNRVYTVWYRSRGFDFDITNSTAFDQAFQYGRNIFDNISKIVDRIFNNFLRRQGRREPFFASYCNGTTATCEGLSQWGSQDLALRGYTPIQILRNYYPNDIQIVESNNFTAIVQTYPGTPLREGSSGEDVRLMQRYLNRISGNFYIPEIPVVDGIFGSLTKNTVIEFQKINNLAPDGIIGKSTWYAITRIYFGVTQLAELTSEGERLSIGANPPTTTLQLGARGEDVVELQFLLNFIAEFYPSVPFVIQNGVFRDATKRAVTEFQKTFGLTPDGIVGPQTWRKLYDVYKAIQGTVELPGPTTPQFPGTPLRLGSRGNDVLLMQNYLNAIATVYPSIPSQTADGIFGPSMQAAVIAFQRQFGLTPDGVIGQITWNKIVSVYNSLSGEAPQFPGTPLRVGSRGSNVLLMQNHLNAIAKIFPTIPTLTADGIFGTGTEAAVIAFQTLFGLTPDGVIGQNTWNRIISIYNSLPDIVVPTYPGTALRVGSRGNDVIIMQKYLSAIAQQYPSIPALTADGIFGPGTERSVIAFQNQFGLTPDGVIGRNTWNKIVSIFNLINLGNVSGFSNNYYGNYPVPYLGGGYENNYSDSYSNDYTIENSVQKTNSHPMNTSSAIPVSQTTIDLEKYTLLLAISMLKK